MAKSMGNFHAKPDAHDAAGMNAGADEEISLLMDSELDDARVEGACSRLRESTAITTWVCYHAIGDALRGQSGLARGFAARFSTRLAQEATVLAPPRARPTPTAVAWAAAATVAAVSVVGWVALTTMPGSDGQAAATIATAKQAAVVRAADARPRVDNEYLSVHEEFSPTTAIQGVRPYLRTIAASEPANPAGR